VSSILLAVVIGFAVTQLANVATTIYLHRTLSHRALVLRPAISFVFRCVLWVTTGIRPREWVAVHRKHHAFTDVDGDPHSPKLLGWAAVQVGNVGLYRRVATDPEQVQRYARDLPPDRWDRALFDRAWLGLAIGVTALILVVGPVVGVVAALLHTGVYLMGSAAVNAVTHTFGPRPYPNGATNLQWVAWITMGEGLHNNHHAAPTSAKFSLRRGEIDPAWPVVWGLQRLRWARIRHDPVTVRRMLARSLAGPAPVA
jgi:stearoyl-CoA desaturase (Delta-9 desaturase)